MNTFTRLSIAAALTLCAAAASAAPFCVVTGMGKQCYFFDEPSCQRVAASQNGACVINSEEARAPAFGAPFCVVSSFGTQCTYYNLQQCENAARAVRGSCAAR